MFFALFFSQKLQEQDSDVTNSTSDPQHFSITTDKNCRLHSARNRGEDYLVTETDGNVKLKNYNIRPIDTLTPNLSTETECQIR